MNSLQIIACLEVLERFDSNEVIKLFEEHFKRHPLNYALISERVLSQNYWEPIEFASMRFASQIAWNKRMDGHGIRHLSFNNIIQDSLNEMLSYKYKTVMIARGGAMMTNWYELSHNFTRNFRDDPVIKSAEIYWSTNGIRFVPIINLDPTNSMIKVPFDDGFVQLHDYKHDYKHDKIIIDTIDDYRNKIVPYLIYAWRIISQFYEKVILNRDLEDFIFKYETLQGNVIVYEPQYK